MLLYEAYVLFSQRGTGVLERERSDAGALLLGIAVIAVLGLLSGALH